jgi:hypothetical protein
LRHHIHRPHKQGAIFDLLLPTGAEQDWTSLQIQIPSILGGCVGQKNVFVFFGPKATAKKYCIFATLGNL